ncbi:MAG: GtrA family protein [Chloroflexi bacterium]|nr:GtrA family protein [Chloroflexota bacterium]
MSQDERTGAPWRAVGRKLLRFSVVGAVGVAVNTVALYIFYGLAGLPLIIAAALAIETAIIHNFWWNDSWTFGQGQRAGRWPRFLKFNAVSLGGLGIATGTLWLLVTLGGVYYLVANLAGVGLATLWNFGVNLAWTWGRRPEAEPEPWDAAERAA